MPYVTPPTFADGNVLSASQLNTLSDDVEFLYGVVRMTNPPFLGEELTAGDGDTESSNSLWVVLHRMETLRYHMSLEQGTADAVRIKYGGVTVFQDSNDQSATYEYLGTVDLTSFAFTVGEVYLVSVEIDGEPGSAVNRLQVYDLREIAP
jgi:hypothetical protein